MFYEDVEKLLVKMHANRDAVRKGQRRPGPYLCLLDVPAVMTDKYDNSHLVEVVTTMASTKFCNLDRYKDFISEGMLQAFRMVSKHVETKVFIALLVRFRQCLRGMATALAKTINSSVEDGYSHALAVSRRFKRARCYRQTGITETRLHKCVAAAAMRIAGRGYYSSWESLEASIAVAMKTCCQGTKLEHFASRQVAADLCKVPGFVGGLTKLCRPATSTLGVGAVGGFFHAERAKGVHRGHFRFPKRVPHLKQTGLCEYHKLVSRVNSPHLKRKAVHRG